MPSYFAWARSAGQAVFFVALAVYGLACSLGAEPDASDDDGSNGSGGTSGTGSGGSGGAPVPAPTLTLEIPGPDGELYAPAPGDTVTREPRQTTDVRVHASDGARTVRFALLPNDEPVTGGDTMPGDAALDATEVETDADGYGQVVLTAPGRPTTFLLRASAGTLASTQLRFSVQGMNQATLEVAPLYDGRRLTGRWTASATPNKTCDELLSTPPDESTEKSSAGPFVRLEGVPVGVPLAVLVRAEHFAWGCANLASAVEGGIPQRVAVVVTDVQIQLEQSRVELALGLDSLDGWVDTLRAPLPSVADALRGDDAEDDVEALLDAMEASLGGADRMDFSNTRGTEKWDTRVREALGPGAATISRAPFEDWLSAGLDGLAGERAFVGALGPSDAAVGSAELALDSVFGLDPAEAGFTVENRGNWSVSADVVLIGMPLEFSPAAFLVAAAHAPAVAEVDDAASIASALGALLPCSAVAAALTEANDCGDDGCERLCRHGLNRLVRQAAGAPLEFATLAIAASGDAGVGPDAELEALDGSWIGKLTYGAETVDVEGNASAQSDD